MLDLATKIATVVATVLSIAIAVGQFTALPRLRKREAFWRDAAQGENAGRAAILLSMRRETMAQIVAREIVPLREMVAPVMALILFTTVSVSAGYSISVERFSREGLHPFNLAFMLSWVFSTGLILHFLAPAFPSLSAERQKIYKAYLGGEAVFERTHLTVVGLLPPAAGLGAKVRWRHHVGPAAFFWGLGDVFFWGGLAWGAPDDQLIWWHGIPNAVQLLMIVPLGGLFYGFPYILSRSIYKVQDGDDWRYPIHLSEIRPRVRSPAAPIRTGLKRRRKQIPSSGNVLGH